MEEWLLRYFPRFFLFFLLLLQSPAFPAMDEPFVITVKCVPGGNITILRPGEPPQIAGKVVALPEGSRWPSFTASAWGQPGAVTATAVNALHILLSVEKGRGRTISILPAETIAPAAGPGAAIVTDIRAGRSIFGAWAPSSGSVVQIIPSGSVTPEAARLPLDGDTLLIRVPAARNPYYVEIENRPGGRVTAWYESGPKLEARVIRPLGGSGRFDGTLYQSAGRIRANHPGVIDICTSPEGLIGGFQIMPLEHASSREMQGAWKMTQWMIVASPDAGTQDLKGTAPLFSGGLVPGTAHGEKLWDLWATYGRKPLVLARVRGGEWGPMPEVSGREDHAFRNVTHLRIYYPFTEEPQAGYENKPRL
jgi:hypothetical protein